MNCRFDDFDAVKTWILLSAGKDVKKEGLFLERRILSSLVDYVLKTSPKGTNVYGKAVAILLFADDLKILDIPGIGIVSRSRIMEIRNYLNEKDLYRWIFDKSHTINGTRKEVPKMALFGDMVEERNDIHLDKDYEISVNGYLVSDDELNSGYKQMRFHMNLTKDEYAGIEKLFSVLDKSRLSYITGLGVSHKGEF